MPIAMDVITEIDAPWVSKRRRTRIMRESFNRMGRQWQTRFKKQHFTSRARSKYNYRQRDSRYKRRKQRLAKEGIVEKGGRQDLVFSGLTERLVMAYHRVRAFPTRATIAMPLPRYVKMVPKNASNPNLGAEITRVSAQEERTLTNLQDKFITDEMNKPAPKRRRRTR